MRKERRVEYATEVMTKKEFAVLYDSVHKAIKPPEKTQLMEGGKINFALQEASDKTREKLTRKLGIRE